MSKVILKGENEIEWHPVCKATDIIYETGVAAIIKGMQIAVYRLRDNSVFALGNIDPHCDVGVMARGIIGSIKGQPVVASPMYKQHFRLTDGVCLENPQLFVASYKTNIVDGTVTVAVPISTNPSPP